MEAVIVIAFGLAAVLIMPMLGALIGGVCGLIVSVFFGNAILAVAHHFAPGVTMWQLGAFLGFVSAFFRTNISTKGKS